MTLLQLHKYEEEPQGGLREMKAVQFGDEQKPKAEEEATDVHRAATLGRGPGTEYPKT